MGNSKPRGRPFQKGKSGNPRGRPKKDYDAQALVAKHTKGGRELVKFWLKMLTLDTVVDATTGRTIAGPTWTEKLAASAKLELRLWGKVPEQLKHEHEHTGKGGAPIEAKVEHTIELDLSD
jgi:hypothetical protein